MREIFKSLNGKVLLPMGACIGIFLIFLFVAKGYHQEIVKIHQEYAQQNVQLLKEIQKAHPETAEIIEENNKFSEDYYTVQSNWLNLWMTLTAGFLGLLGVIMPILFADRMEKYKQEFDKIKDDAETTLKEFDQKTLKGQVAQIQEDMKQIYQWKQDTQAYTLFTQALNEKEDPQKAIEYYKKAIEIKPNYADAYCNLGISYANIQNFDEALKSIKKSLELNPNNARTHCNLGITYAKMGKDEKAMEILKKAATNDPSSAEIQYNLGVEYGRRQNIDKMIECFEKAVELKPDFIEAHYSLGTKYLLKGDFEKAIKSLENAIKLNPQNEDAYCNLGAVFSNLKEHEKAAASFIKCLEINPEHKIAIKNLSLAYTNIGAEFNKNKNYTEAIDILNEAIKINPKNQEAYASLAVSYAGLGKLEIAHKNIEKAFELKPEDEQIQGLRKQIIEDLDKIKKDQSNPPDAE